MRISDWSSDVCSSDLLDAVGAQLDTARRCSLCGGRGSGSLFTAGCALVPVQQQIASAAGNQHDCRRSGQIFAIHGCKILHCAVAAWRASRASASARARRASISSDWVSAFRSEEHTSELQSLMRISYAVFCLKKKKIYRKMQTSY